ncbi:MAG: glycogen debranching protein [Actinomycetota bacterium]|nr:glycogen debranching protein [Actinomycetota bacterium]
MVRKLAGVAVSMLMIASVTGAVAGPARRQSTIPSPGPTLSVADRLADRRYVATGPRAYVVGTEDGRFPAMGFHTRGEMGGIWSPPIKLLDGLWFGIDDTWIGSATRFTSGYGYVGMELPGTDSLEIRRVDFVPGGRRAVLVGLELTAPGAAQSFTLKVDAHSELMGAYPWGETDPSQTDFNLEDSAQFRNGALVFRERGTPPVPNAPRHNWASLVASNLPPSGHRIGSGFRGPQGPPVICPVSTSDAPQPDRCDDTEYGKGAGGRLLYDVSVPAGGTKTVWFAVAGSDRGVFPAFGELKAALDHPRAALEAKIAHRRTLARRTRLYVPGDPLLARGIQWSKQNLADSVQRARGLAIRETNAGVNYPAPEGTLEEARWLGAGFPDYPWLFGTDGEFTAFASVAVGQFAPIKDHLRALRDSSRIVNGSSGKVVHEVVGDGSVYFGTNADEGNTDETAKFPSAVALVWRWTGDNKFRDEMYGFAKDNMRYIYRALDADNDGWPEGLGNVEREGMGEEKLDNTVYTIRGLLDLADMAASKGDDATVEWAKEKARRLRSRFESAWWMPQVPQHADSLDDPGNAKLQQRHWIGVTPMEVELPGRVGPRPGLTTRRHGVRALELRETDCYGDAFGLFHTGAPGCDPIVSDAPAERVIFTLNTALMAVAEGNYGRLRDDQQRRFTTANRRLQLPNPDEQPGAMPEIAPSPDYGRSIDLHLNERAMVLQAWGNYGTAWPAVHQQLGVRPDLGNDRLQVVPQVPPGSPGLGGKNIRLGKGSVNVSALAEDGTYVTVVGAKVDARLRLGHTLPFGARVASARLNGAPVDYKVRVTHRGREVIAAASAERDQILVIKSSG